VTAINISNGAAAYLSKNNAEGVRGILRKQATNPEIAYILVENRKGEIIAQTFTALPENIPSTVAGGARNESQRALRLEGGEVYEVIMPVLDGQAGAVRLGIWRDHIEAEVSRTVKPLIQMLWWVAVGGVLMSVYLAWRINRPIIRLVRAAQRISTGDLEAPSLGVEDNSEFGELSRALERMRSSIKAAMVRMRDD
jgi:HAMP domain-containing protein